MTFAAGDSVLYQGHPAKVVGLDTPLVTIDIEGKPGSVVVSAAALTPADSPSFSLDDLFDKISGFRESLQIDDLPMLSKAAVLAQIVTAQQLARIADHLKPRYFAGNGDDLEAIVIEELNRADVDGLAVKDADLTLARRVAQRMASSK